VEGRDTEPPGAAKIRSMTADGTWSGRARRAARTVAGAARRIDVSPALLAGARRVRERLPGDPRFGDRLSTGGREQSQLLGRRLAEVTGEQPSVLREVGLSALQVWEALSESQGRGRGDRDLAILFTDLAGFSAWALEAGDDAALELLRRVGTTVEPGIEERGGTIVKRLGDGLMAVFDDAPAAVAAALHAAEAVQGVEVDGHRPQLRAGVHFGRPRRLGGDYFGVDVNVAARVAAAAGPGEVLASETVRERLGEGDLSLRRRWRFRAKGTPKGMKVFAVEPGA
jgi:adenylate cyclase